MPDVVKNTALKIVHRLPAQDDRELVGATMNLDAEQSRQVVSFPPGVAAVFADGMDRPLRVRVPFGGHAERPPGPGELAAPPIAARRSAACGPQCTGAPGLHAARAALGRPARQVAGVRLAAGLDRGDGARLPDQLPAAGRADGAASALGSAWMSDCANACSPPLPNGPSPAGPQAVRDSFAPEELTAAVGEVSAADPERRQGRRAPRSDRDWVIPQLQWLHEIERALPLTGPTTDPFELALPLEFELPGLVDRPDIKIGQRVSALRRHPLSMELDSNRLPAWTALLGADDQRAFSADLAILAVGSSHRGQLLQAAGEMGVVGWLEPVLSWPRRFIVGYDARRGARRQRRSCSG